MMDVLQETITVFSHYLAEKNVRITREDDTHTVPHHAMTDPSGLLPLLFLVIENHLQNDLGIQITYDLCLDPEAATGHKVRSLHNTTPAVMVLALDHVLKEASRETYTLSIQQFHSLMPQAA